ncbi:MAG: hypothetical protein MJ082_05545 [Clostridia bacterium]|nr:hypothetical protein [Clostridia bacterium]
MKKAVIVINGAGGVGKDTLCNLAARHFKVKNISSITPIKNVAKLCGWDGGKDDKSRKFLSDLKALTVAYNDYPTRWATEEYRAFLASDEQVMFVHIREGSEIAKFVSATDGKAKTLLVRGGTRYGKVGGYGNVSDDDVENYPYDYFYVNEKTLGEAEEEFSALIHEILNA